MRNEVVMQKSHRSGYEAQILLVGTRIEVESSQELESAVSDRTAMLFFLNKAEPEGDLRMLEHPFTGIEITDKGIAMMADYVAQVREVIGMEIPLAADHFGHIGVNSCIRLAKALEKHNMAWLEDMVPWFYTDLQKKITDAVDVPILTGEDIYLKEGFAKLCDTHAVDMIHPIWPAPAGYSKLRRLAITQRSAAWPWPCTSLEARSVAWPMCTVQQPRATSFAWKFTLRMSSSGMIWWRASQNQLSSRGTSPFPKRRVSALR